ncbi:MAG: hypothetical protein E7374_02110 [Clostridiales bacterium]|nr:hypothetical protein [Clostridiales bacterium]
MCYNMGVLDNIKDKVKQIFNYFKSDADFLQYIHMGSCTSPCMFCPIRDKKIYKNGEEVSLPAHLRCDCKYVEIETKSVGNISNKGFQAPDVYLKAYGKLPDYYITKDEAMQKYGWSRGKDLSKYAPNKMIGGDRFYNNRGILPEKEGRLWYECDVDYDNGLRDGLRLYYSNDGLIFYSEFHDESKVVFIK